MKLASILCFVQLTFGQAGVLNLAGPASVKGATPFTVTLSTSGGAGYAIAGFVLNVGTDVATITAALGPVAIAAGKAIQCGPLAGGKLPCAIGGFGSTLNKTAMADGALAIFTVTLIASPVLASESLFLAPTQGADGTGTLVTTTAGATLILPVANKCDLNGSGAVDGTDLGIAINAYLAWLKDGTVTAGTDLNGDGKVDLADVMKVFLAIPLFGGVCTAQ